MKLPQSSGDPITFFMYPQAETAEGRRDSLDPESFRYRMSARELAAGARGLDGPSETVTTPGGGAQESLHATAIRSSAVTSPTSQQRSPRRRKSSTTVAARSAGTANSRPPEVSDSKSRLTSASGNAGSMAS